eukprot:5601608-Karenia_brevis.AAC.1
MSASEVVEHDSDILVEDHGQGVDNDPTHDDSPYITVTCDFDIDKLPDNVKEVALNILAWLKQRFMDINSGKPDAPQNTPEFRAELTEYEIRVNKQQPLGGACPEQTALSPYVWECIVDALRHVVDFPMRPWPFAIDRLSVVPEYKEA